MPAIYYNLLQVLLNDEPVSSRQVLVSVRESEEDPDPDNMVFMVARRGTNVTLNCSDLGETGEVTWTRQGSNVHIDQMIKRIHLNPNML